jgi:hypothetical protein
MLEKPERLETRNEITEEAAEQEKNRMRRRRRRIPKSPTQITTCMPPVGRC